jgi:nucleoside 2-deoxyribosyltransferase
VNVICDDCPLETCTGNSRQAGEKTEVGKRVFVSGPIQGMETEQDYRDQIRKLLVRYGYVPVDPWQREKVMYRGPPEEWWNNVPPKGFIRRDLEDIERCDALIAYLPKLSAGTCMELFYAKLKGKKTVTVCEIRDPSPWVIAHSDIVIKNVKELEDRLKEGM